MMAPQPVPFPGFTAISDRVYVQDGDQKAESSATDEPTSIVIFGWGDAKPNPVSKYADGFRELFPSARIIVVLSGTMQAAHQTTNSRIKTVMPVIDLIFPTPSGSGDGEERVLLHAMSNTGGVFAGATVAAYQRRHGADKMFPHKLLVLDSTPGSVHFASQVGRWSRAMAVGTAKHFPWPFFITQAMWYVYLWANWAWEKLRGAETAGVWACRTLTDRSVTTLDSSRLYLYSKEDDIILWGDLEDKVAEAKALGYSADVEMFEGSPHVGHMKLHPEQYWSKILDCWKAAQAKA